MRSSIKTPYLKKTRTAIPKRSLNRVERQAAPDDVGGIIQGKNATAPEMKWAKGLVRANKEFIFQYEVPTAYTLPGQGKTIDFIVEGQWADEIDGEIAHKTFSQRAKDEERDILLSENLHKLGLNDIRRIDAALFTDDKHVDDMIREHYL